MKIHIPLTLRAALLAALCACHTAQAATTTYEGTATLSAADLKGVSDAEVRPGALITLDSTITELAISSLTNYGTISVTDKFSLSSGSVLNASNSLLSFAKGATLESGTSFTNQGSVSAEGQLIVADGATLVNQSGGVVRLQGGATVGKAGGATITNNGTIDLYGAVSFNPSRLVNKGTVNVYGTVTVDGARLNGNGTINLIVSSATPVTGNKATLLRASSISGLSTLPNYRVTLDLSHATGLVGNTYTFITAPDKASWVLPMTEDGKVLVNRDSQLSWTGDYSVDWEKGSFTIDNYDGDNKLESQDIINFTLQESAGHSFTGITFNDVKHTVYIDDNPVDLNITTKEIDSETQDLSAGSGSSGTLNLDGGATGTPVDSALTADTTTTGQAVSGTVNRQIVYALNVSATGGAGTITVQAETILVTQTQQGGTNTTVVGQGGLRLTLSTGTLQGSTGNVSDNILGFDTGASGSLSITSGSGTTPTNYIIQTADEIVVKAGETVTLNKLTANANKSLTLESGSSLTLTAGTQIVIGGGALTTTVEYEASGSTGGTASGSLNADRYMGLSADSTITGAELNIHAGSSLSAHLLKDATNQHVDNSASTSFVNSTVILTSDNRNVGNGNHVASIGSTDAGAQTLLFENSVLKGTGIVRNVHMKGGTLSIGNSPGILAVDSYSAEGATWCFTLDATSVAANELATAIDDPTRHSQLQLLSNARADNTLITFSYGHTDSSTGNWVEEVGRSAVLDNQLEAGFAVRIVDLNGQQLAGSFVLDTASLPTLDAGLVWSLATLQKDGYLRVIGELLGDPNRVANTLVSAGQTTADFGQAALGHARDARLSGQNVWVSALGSFIDHDSRGGRSGFEYNASGYAVGADTTVGNNSVLGIALGQSYGKHKPDRGNGFFTPGEIDQDGVMLGLYGRSCLSTKCDTHLDSYITYGSFSNDSTRNSLNTGRAATASWDEDALCVGATYSCNLHWGSDDNPLLTPFVGLHYTYVSMEDFTERGDVAAAYTGSSYQNLALQLGVGISRSYAIGTQRVTPYASLAYVGDILRRDAKVTATGQQQSVTDYSVKHSRNAVQCRVGANWQLTPAWGAAAGYTLDMRQDAADQSLNATLHYSF